MSAQNKEQSKSQIVGNFLWAMPIWNGGHGLPLAFVLLVALFFVDGYCRFPWGCPYQRWLLYCYQKASVIGRNKKQSICGFTVPVPQKKQAKLVSLIQE
jgi:hypothetical protein